MFFKSATVACSLAALLMVGCDTDNNEVDDTDEIVAPGDDYSPDTPAPGTTDEPAPGTTGDDLEPATPPAFPEDTTPDADADSPEADEPSLDEPVVEEVEADSLPEDNE